MTNVLVPKLFRFAKIFRFGISAPHFSVGETLHVAYKKYNIFVFFTFSGKYQICFFSLAENIRRFTRAAHSC